MKIHKNILLLYTCLLTFGFSYGQLILTNGIRNKTINYKRQITFTGKKITITSDTIYYKYSGHFITMSNDSVLLRPTQSSLVINYLDNRSRTISTEYINDSLTTAQISIYSIRNVKTSNKTIDGICSVVGALGFLTATIISPIISVNYNNGMSYRPRYAVMTGLSIATIAASITFDLSCSKRKYKFNKINNPWKIKA